MGVQFSIEANTTGALFAPCLVDDRVIAQGDEADVLTQYAAHLAECDACAPYDEPTIFAVLDAPREFDVDMHASGAMRALEALGLLESSEQAHAFDVPEMCGSESGEAFLGRVLLALAIAPQDEGMPSEVDGHWTECGRAAGDLQRRLADLRALAEEAVRLGREVVWG